LNNGEVLESVAGKNVRHRKIRSRYIPFDGQGKVSQHAAQNDPLSLRLVSRWSLSSPPLTKGSFELPPVEPRYHHPDEDSENNDHWPFPPQLVEPTQLHQAADKAARRMVSSPSLPGEVVGHNGSKGHLSKFTFVRSEFVLNPTLLKLWRKRLKSTRLECAASGDDVQHFTPVLAWHSTPWHGNIDKIIQNGVLAEGDRMGDTGQFLGTAHGQR
jgi:hypothetical protein